jgi:hypothetical protein
MKRLLLLLSILFSGLLTAAQTYISAETRFFVNDLKHISPGYKTSTYLNEDLVNKYPIYKRNGNNYISFVAVVEAGFNPESLAPLGIRFGSRTGNIITLRVPVDKVDLIDKIPGIKYIQIAGKITPSLDKAVKDTKVDSVWKGINLPQPYTGKDVLIGITDWGFDYSNPNFYDTTLSQTRILKAWDQWRNAGPAPTGYDYGTEISGETDLLFAKCDTFNVYEYAYHGSHVAGICGGSGAGTNYRGVAFEANYLMATFLVDEAAVIDAFNWMADYSQTVGKRLVINMSWGLYYMGSMDGQSILSQVIDQLSSEGVIFVAAAGNNGDVNFHLKHTFTGSDTLKTQVGFDNYSYYPKMYGQSITIWGEPGKSFKTALKIYGAGNVFIDSTQFFSTDDTLNYKTGEIIIGTDTIFYTMASDSANPQNQRPHIRLRIKNLKYSTYKVGLFVTSASGTVNLWNVIELTNDVGNWGSAFTSAMAGWSAGDAFYGVGEPACANSLIAVAAYSSEYKLINGVTIGGGIAAFSSYGPTIDGRVKPDVAAPGVSVCSSISSYTNATVSPITATITFNGRSYKFAKLSGTSMASPMVTGIVALMLEANKWLTAADVKNILKQTARQDSKTGVIPATGSTRWGWGKVNAYNAVKMALTGIEENSEVENSCILYPNPVKDILHFIHDESFSPKRIEIYTTLGSLAGVFDIKDKPYLNIDFLSAGMYIVKISGGESVIIKKLIKQ